MKYHNSRNEADESLLPVNQETSYMSGYTDLSDAE